MIAKIVSGMTDLRNMHHFKGKKLNHHKHWLVLVRLTRKRQLLRLIHLHLRHPVGGKMSHQKASLVHVEAPDAPQAPQGFVGGSYDLSILPLYPDHASRHMWDGKVKLNFIYYLKHIWYNNWSFWRWFIFLQDGDALKCINNGRKIVCLLRPPEQWFKDVMQLSELQYFCMTCYVILSIFVERDGIQRHNFFILHMVRYLSPWTMSHACCIFQLGGDY